MPKLVLFRDANGRTPILEWLDGLPPKARQLCGPEADYLRNGIYELRIKSNGVQYRILYFFHGPEAVVISHGIIKQQAEVPAQAIALALERRHAFLANPVQHIDKENRP